MRISDWSSDVCSSDLLHGRGNKNGEGDGVRVMAYDPPENPGGAWNYKIVDRLIHMSHNLEIVPDGDRELVYVCGKEGVRNLKFEAGQWAASWLDRKSTTSDLQSQMRISYAVVC